ncbi:MAG: MBL fold metallo-hydrolase [Desulforhopalus sp.]
MTQLQQHIITTPYMVGPVHCYSGRFAGELVLFDTGPPTVSAREYLRDHIALDELQHVLITHCHIDHFGQARWLEQNSSAIIYLPERDSRIIGHHDNRVKALREVLSGFGFGKDYLDNLQKVFDERKLLPTLPQKFKVAEKELPQRLGIDVLPCPGHSQSDLVYIGSDWAVTGDTLLKGVFQSPVLDVDPETGARYRNYEAYCATVVKLSGLKGKTVFTAHRRPVTDIDDTLFFYISKLLRRVKALHPYREEDNLQLLIDKLLKGRLQDTMQIYLKASEIIFMKDFLNQPELLRESLEQTGLFSVVSELFNSAVTSC